jgi:hypothetical protein
LNKQLVEVLDFAVSLTFLVRSTVEVDIIELGLGAAVVVVVVVVDIAIVIAIVITDIVVVELLLVAAEATSCRIDSYVLPD